MNILIFNHHPDCLWNFVKPLERLGINCYVATHDLTFQAGADYSSVSTDFKLRHGPLWFSEEDLYREKFLKYKDNFNNIDLILTIHRDIAKNNLIGRRNLFHICVEWDLHGCNDSSRYIKASSHHDHAKYSALYLPHIAPQFAPDSIQKKYISQLVENFTESPYTEKLEQLKQRGLPVIVAGRHDAPDGVKRDWETLYETTLLVHHKRFGGNCYAVMKALECGIPVYTSKENKLRIGMGDLPDELFLYDDEYTLEEAYEKSFIINNKQIQAKFRKIRNIDTAAKYLQKILMSFV